MTMAVVAIVHQHLPDREAYRLMFPPSSLNGFDVGSAVERMLGQPDLWWQAVGLFVEHFAEWEQGWLSVRGDDSAEQRKVHALRSAAANVGASNLSCAAAVLEELLVMRQQGKSVQIPQSVRWYVQDCFREAWRAAAEARCREQLCVAGSA
jgi:HPt (histidine-containing phosphotransfer) domain-containing protein